ncbi:OstA-like protein [Sporocytophaga myxococcoides]|uniref:OstA-like protein n=1 Tax=Sporocytophaga myxococcoides TaxID=153721 RepID=UPI000407B1F1|nr:OstA-like protein [Sporocytophaga myxococcoides]
MRYCLYLFFLLVFIPDLVNAQGKIDLVQAKELEGITVNGVNIRRLKGDVIFKQQGTYLYCDSAYQNPKNNSIEAFGNVRMNQGDTVNLTCRNLLYEGNTKKTIAKRNVVLKDKTMTLFTDVLHYDVSARRAFYPNGGTIKDEKSTLTSREGYYNLGEKIFNFRKDVRVVNPSQNFVLTTDSLDYNSYTNIAYFKGPTKIISPDGVVVTTEGEYNIMSKVTATKERSNVQSGNFDIEADNLDYDERKGNGIARGNVILKSPKDSVLILGERANYWSKRGTSKVFGNPVMKNYSGGDTLFLSADTLISLDYPEKNIKKLIAYKHTKIFRHDLQGKCDSLVYDFADSTIYFFGDPVLWSEKNQIVADSINILLVNNKVSKMNMKVNAFMASIDSLENYNQVKGKKMVAHFLENKIQKVDVNGNGESLYFALEGDTVLIGMNKVVCSDLVVRFKEAKVNTISFIKSPDAKFIPPHEILEPETRLKGFVWRGKERPSKKDVLGVRYVN